MARIPVNIIAGFLGVGKTTAILNLLKNKPADEYWAVVVNEFGEVSIDGPLIASVGDHIKVKDISGGCMCCVGKMMFDAALADLAVKVKPDRIIIEPSGLGHIGDIIRTIKSKTFAKYVSLKAPICLIDPRHLKDPFVIDSLVFQMQLENSSIVIANKSDLVTEEELEIFHDWANKIVQPLVAIRTTAKGIIPFELLDQDMPAREEKALRIVRLVQPKEEAEHKVEKPHPRKPVIIENRDDSFTGIGILFHAHDFFNSQKLTDFFSGIQCLRMKGIFNTDKGWQILQKANTELTTDKALPHDDSRMEVIFTNASALDSAEIKEKLITCIDK